MCVCVLGVLCGGRGGPRIHQPVTFCLFADLFRLDSELGEITQLKTKTQKVRGEIYCPLACRFHYLFLQSVKHLTAANEGNHSGRR